MANPTPTTHPGGCFFGFNAAVDRRAMELLINACNLSRATWRFSRVTIAMSCIGGEMDQAFYGFNLLRALPGGLTMHNVGGVQSCGNILFLAGDERVASPGTSFFFHQTAILPPALSTPNAAGLRLTQTILAQRVRSTQRDDSRTVDLIADRTGQAASVIRGWMRNEMTIDESRAMQFGIVNRVAPFALPVGAYFEPILIV